MKQTKHDLIIEYQYQSSPGSEERYSDALDLIIDLILQDIQDHPEALSPPIIETR